jgi:hypothetical protein
MDLLFKSGALDVFYAPIFMKKNRPSYMLSVILKPKDRELMEEIIFMNTSSIGVRYTSMERTILDREQCSIETKYGLLLCKVCSYKGNRKVYPEYDSLVKLAQKNNVSYKEIYNCVSSLSNVEIK